MPFRILDGLGLKLETVLMDAQLPFFEPCPYHADLCSNLFLIEFGLLRQPGAYIANLYALFGLIERVAVAVWPYIKSRH